MSRRGFITGSIGLLCAPAILRATSLMPVKALPRLIYAGELGTHEGFSFMVNDTEAVKLWSRLLAKDVQKESHFFKMLKGDQHDRS